MAELSDAFLVLPGEIGTLEEIFEVWTWGQLGEHRKPLGIVNVGGYYDGLIQFLGFAQSEGFLRDEYRHMLLVAESPAALFDAFSRYKPPSVGKWISPADV
jgi:uncharacterized protein (TIGR00730 family)